MQYSKIYIQPYHNHGRLRIGSPNNKLDYDDHCNESDARTAQSEAEFDKENVAVAANAVKAVTQTKNSTEIFSKGTGAPPFPEDEIQLVTQVKSDSAKSTGVSGHLGTGALSTRFAIQNLFCCCIRSKRDRTVVQSMSPVSYNKSSLPASQAQAQTPQHHSDAVSSRYTLPIKKMEHLKRKTLLIDLDETLVNSSMTPIANADLSFTVNYKGRKMPFHISVRPYAREFLAEMSKHYELVIFTASMSEYATPVIDFIDPDKHASHRLFRDTCTMMQGSFTKDLNRVNRPIKDLILLDNSEHSFVLQPENGLLIKSYFHHTQNDNELPRLVPFLRFIARVYDVRHVEGWQRKFQVQNNLEYVDMDLERQYWQHGKQVLCEARSSQNSSAQDVDSTTTSSSATPVGNSSGDWQSKKPVVPSVAASARPVEAIKQTMISEKQLQAKVQGESMTQLQFNRFQTSAYQGVTNLNNCKRGPPLNTVLDALRPLGANTLRQSPAISIKNTQIITQQGSSQQQQLVRTPDEKENTCESTNINRLQSIEYQSTRRPQHFIQILDNFTLQSSNMPNQTSGKTFLQGTLRQEALATTRGQASLDEKNALDTNFIRRGPLFEKGAQRIDVLRTSMLASNLNSPINKDFLMREIAIKKHCKNNQSVQLRGGADNSASPNVPPGTAIIQQQKN